MPDKFDPYREALVMEVVTIWPEDYDDWKPNDRERIEKRLHENPQDVSQLQYVRTHSGFCREITVTEEDVRRLM